LLAEIKQQAASTVKAHKYHSIFAQFPQQNLLERRMENRKFEMLVIPSMQLAETVRRACLLLGSVF